MAANITISATINAPIEKIWKLYTHPEHIVNWNSPSPDWHTTKAENDLFVGGKFDYRMEAKDGSFGFDFWGNYDIIVVQERIDYTLGDGRKVVQTFTEENDQTKIVIVFEAETENTIELQRGGWQAILDNFKKYTETN